MPKFGQKNVKSVKTTMFMGQQSQYYAVFSDFLRKNTALMSIFSQKKRQFSKKPIALMPIFYQLTSILS